MLDIAKTKKLVGEFWSDEIVPTRSAVRSGEQGWEGSGAE